MSEPEAGGARPPLAPGSVIGVLGGGQLGRMLALAAARLGLQCHILTPEAASPAAQVAMTTVAAYDDETALARFAETVDVVTYEFENVPCETAAFLAARRPLFPSVEALRVTQDRLAEKSFLADLGLGTAPFAALDDAASLLAAIDRIGLPAVLKTRRLGYDGKGQVVLRTAGEADAAWRAIGAAPAILEGFVTFEREVSILAVRNRDGVVATYDLVENEHRDQILHVSRVPARATPEIERQARAIAETVSAGLDYVGVLAVELFLVGDRLLVNEIAPRVHNSGHWTIDACLTSQFENHIRAVAGWPLGSTARHSNAEMVNLIGDEAGAWRELAAEPVSALHLYGKHEARPGRKMGHLTRLSPRG